MHEEVHPRSGEIVILATGEKYVLEDWWDHLTGKSWQDSNVIAAYNYATRVYHNSLPSDNEVVYGKIGEFGYLVHVSELLD